MAQVLTTFSGPTLARAETSAFHVVVGRNPRETVCAEIGKHGRVQMFFDFPFFGFTENGPHVRVLPVHSGVGVAGKDGSWP